MASRLGEVRHFYCNEGLSVGLQILLSSRQEYEGTDDVGGGKGSHRLYIR